MDKKNTAKSSDEDILSSNKSPFEGHDEPLKQKISPVVLWTTIIGLIAVLGAIFYLVLLRDTLPPPTETPVSMPTVEPSIPLTLESPTDGELAVEDTILVQGTTVPNATVAVFTEAGEDIVESDDTGYFETTALLEPGINTLVVTAFSEDGSEENITLTIIHDTES